MSVTRLFHPQGPDRVAVVSTQPSWTHPGRLLVTVARGPGAGPLRDPESYGPFDPEPAEARAQELVGELLAQGFVRSGSAALLEALGDASEKRRALGALRLGWRRERSAVEALLQALESARSERSSIVEALGAIGDTRAIPALRAEAERKLLSRRRPAAEALRAIGDAPGLEQVRERARARLPASVRQRLEEGAGPTALVAALLEAPAKDRGLAVDSLYELGEPPADAAALAALEELPLHEPWVWRYAKSVLKRAMLRHDSRGFGRLAHRIERVGRSHGGARATLKSGYDGKLRETRVFGPRTRDYLRRRAWRYLRRLARYRPELYAHAAAAVVARYGPEDEAEASGRFGTYAGCYLLHRVLWGGGRRFELKRRSLRFQLREGQPALAPAGDREEAYPALWDAQPSAYLLLLGESRLPVVHEFALAAVRERHRAALEAATPGQLLALLSAVHPDTVDLGLEELGRRFTPEAPDWAVLEALLADERERLRALGLEWLATTSRAWSRDTALCARLLVNDAAAVRVEAARLCGEALAEATPEELAALARRVLALLSEGEAAPEQHEALAAVAQQRLLPALGELVGVDELRRLLDAGSPAAQAVAARLLARRPDAERELGPELAAAMARHRIRAVRESGLALLERSLPRLAEDPSLLLEVAECDWPDGRAGAVALLGRLDASALGLDQILELLDSSHPEVQAQGQRLLRATRERWDPVGLVARLSEHPARSVRPFVMELVEALLAGDLAGLPDPEAFFRKVLFDLRPSRRVKRRAIELLARNGERDETQAQVAVAVLGDVLRSQTRHDFEQALVALARVQLAFPEIETPLALRPGETP